MIKLTIIILPKGAQILVFLLSYLKSNGKFPNQLNLLLITFKKIPAVNNNIHKIINNLDVLILFILHYNFQ